VALAAKMTGFPKFLSKTPANGGTILWNGSWSSSRLSVTDNQFTSLFYYIL